MNFTAVRGFNAYAQFSAKIREAVKSRSETSNEPEADLEYSHSIYSEPIDTVTISDPARKASAGLTAASPAQPGIQDDMPDEASPKFSVLRDNGPHIEFREWLRTSGTSTLISGGFSQKIPGSIMNNVLAGSGVAVNDDEEFSIKIDMLSMVTVSSRNTEKAKAIQNLLNSTPSGINWGLLLATLPPN